MAKNYKGHDPDGAALIRKANQHFYDAERANAQRTWKLLTEFIIPNENRGWWEDPAKGIRRDQRVYDATAIQSNRDLASAMQSTITSPSAKWSSFRFKNEKVNDIPAAMNWLDHVRDTLHDHLNESNFNAQVGKGYLLLSGLGQMILFQDEDFTFDCWALQHVAFAENDKGVVDTIFRRIHMTLKEAYDKFGSALGEEMVDQVDKMPLKDLEIIHAILPRDPSLVNYGATGDLAMPQDRPFRSVYILTKGSRILEDGGFYEFPVFIARWAQLPDEVYGFGPGNVCLADVRSLNKVREESLKALAKAVNPPIITTKQNMISGDLRPGGTVNVRDIGQFKEFITQTKFDAVKLEIDDLKNSIKGTFYIDKLLLPPRNETGEMTAYEVSQRLEQMQQILGPVLSKFNAEFLTPLIMRSINILFRQNKIIPLPLDVQQAIGQQKGQSHSKHGINIEFINSLARSQKMSELQNIQSWLQEVMQMAQMQQGQVPVLDNINFDKVLEYSARVRNIPESMIMDPAAVAKKRAAAQKQQQLMQAMQAGEQMGNTAQAVAGAHQSVKGATNASPIPGQGQGSGGPQR